MNTVKDVKSDLQALSDLQRTFRNRTYAARRRKSLEDANDARLSELFFTRSLAAYKSARDAGVLPTIYRTGDFLENE